ncbi:MAG: sensor histidine kinase [Phycisphaeraceae bacterium]
MARATDNPAAVEVDGSREDLAEIILAYNRVTENLQASHERLKGEVLRLRKELASTNAQLQRSRRLSALGEMAAGIAHEIRNPLAAIQLYAEMIVDDLGPDRLDADAATDGAKKIAAAVRGLNGIVNDVLSFARELSPQPQPVLVSELFERALAEHRPAIEAAEVAVVRPGAEADGLEVCADSNLMHQAMLNLVRNAVDAMAGRDERTLTFAASEGDESVTLEVRDSGPGIDEEDVDRIFNPFFTTRDTGTGLGLAIVHRIVDAHGGAIVVHNDPDRGGAVFQLSLPREPAGETAQPEVETDENASGEIIG